MFKKARLKLTAWYLLIIMVISISFSIAIYRVLTNEITRIERIQKLRQEHLIPSPLPTELRERTFRFDPELVEETDNRLKLILLLINLGVLGFSSFAGYFLAGKTLKPLKDMVDEQNRFVTDASHELRTPLTSLKTSIEVNLRNKSLDLPAARKLLNSNLEDVNNLQSLSDSLIKLSQYEKNTVDYVVGKIYLTQVIKDSIKKVDKLAKHKKIKILINIKDDSVIGDKKSLSELFVILLDNAIKYSPNNSKINISSRSMDGQILVEVADQGTGVSEEDINHLFDRFYRVSKSRTKNQIPGYGLGLSIAKKIVERHDGTITVKSEIGKGSVFSVSIARAENA